MMTNSIPQSRGRMGHRWPYGLSLQTRDPALVVDTSSCGAARSHAPLRRRSQRMQVVCSNSEARVPLQPLSILSHRLTLAVSFV